MKDEIKVSVVIPVYNAEDYLEEGLNSVINQTLKEIEIICVDDGSSDSSLNILQRYKKKDNRFIILKQENQGAGKARNLGLKNARGEYVHFLDADDYLVENAYEVMYSKAKQFNVDMIKARTRGIDACSGKKVYDSRYDLTFIKHCDYHKVFNVEKGLQRLVENVAVVPWNGIYRREFLIANKIEFNSLVCVNDRSFFNHAIVAAEKVVIIPEIVINHRMNIATSLIGRRAKHFECHFQSYKIIEKLCGGLTERQKAIILNEELADVFSWYKRYRNSEIYGKQIEEQMKSFLKDVDIKLFQKNNIKATWKRTWRELTDENYKSPFSIMPQSIREFIFCFCDNGVGYTVSYVGKKILMAVKKRVY